MSEKVRHVVLLAVAASAVLFFRLGDARLWDRDEPRNARCAVEMLERNDWIVPTFNAELRSHKPVLLYWFIMTAYSVLGVNEFAARFPSAILGVGTVLCTYFLGRRLFGPRAGLLAGVCLIPALMFNVASRAATPDATLLFFFTATLTAFVCGRSRNDEELLPNTHRAWLVVYALMATAVLAKGPVGFVLPIAIMTLSVWLQRHLLRGEGPSFRERLKFAFAPSAILKIVLEMRPLHAIAMLLLIAVPWYAWVGVRTEGEFLVGFFWDHNIRRATESMEGHSGSPFLYYPLALSVGFFPASVFAIPMLLNAVKSLRSRSSDAGGILFCFVWIATVVGLFSFAKTKLPSYVTPCYPALAVLTGLFLARWTEGRLLVSRRWLQVAFGVLAIVGTAAGGALYWVGDAYLPGEQWLGGIGAILLVGGVACFVVAHRSPEWSLRLFAAASFLFSASLMGMGGAAADRHRESGRLFDTAERQTIKPEYLAWRCLEPSWVFYTGRPIRELWTGEQEAAKFLVAHSRHYLLVKRSDYASLSANLPQDFEILEEVPAFLKKDRLLLVGRRANNPHAVAAENKDTLPR